MNRSMIHRATYPFAEGGGRGQIAAGLVIGASLAAAAGSGVSLSLTPDKWFAIAAFVVLKVYLGLTSDTAPFRG